MLDGGGISVELRNDGGRLVFDVVALDIGVFGLGPAVSLSSLIVAQ